MKIKKYKHILLGFWLIFIFCRNVSAQNDGYLNQQVYNRMHYNPAAIEKTDDIQVFSITRFQWVNFSGAPKTQLLNVDNYLSRFNSGIGLVLLYDALGMEKNVNIKIAYSYHLQISDQSSLYMGLSGGILQKGIALNEAVYENPQSVALKYDRERKINPDFDFGLQYTHEKGRAGVSITHLNTIKEDNTVLTSTRQLYLYAEYTFPLKDESEIKPSAGFTTTGRIGMFDINAMYYAKNYFGGLSLRTNEKLQTHALALLLGVRLFQNFKLGYSFDLPLNALGKNMYPSHEIMLSFRFNKKNVHTLPSF